MSEISRVVHIRVRNSTILTCYKLTELQQGTTDTPMSTMLSDILDSLAGKLVSSGKLPLISDEEAAAVLDAIYRRQEEIEKEIDLPEPDMMGIFADSVEVEDDVVEDNLSLHTIPLDKDFQKRSSDEQQMIEEKINYPDKPPWESDDISDFYGISLRSPKDILIEAAYKNKHLQRAIQLVYPILPIDMWGSPKAQSLVAEVMPLVIHYLGPIPTEQPENKEQDEIS